MVGSLNNGRNHHRCTYSSKYADANLHTTLQDMTDAQHDDADQQHINASSSLTSQASTRYVRDPGLAARPAVCHVVRVAPGSGQGILSGSLR
jgi:hypothetical protein